MLVTTVLLNTATRTKSDRSIENYPFGGEVLKLVSI